MADELDTQTESTDTPKAEPATPPSAPATQGLTAEQVQFMIAEAQAKAHDAAYAKARREFKAKAKEQPKTETETAEPRSGDDPMALLALRDAFDDAIGDITLTAKQKRFLRERVMRERPDDVDQFVADAVEVMGIGSKPSNPTQPASPQQTTPAHEPPKAAQPTPPPSAPTNPDREGDPAFRALTEESARDLWQSYVRRKGAVPGNPYDARNRAVWRELRRRFEEQAATTRVLLGARRG